MAGIYSGSSAPLPDTTWVAIGKPNGSSTESITLPLGQVGTVVFTIAQLEQSLFRHRPIPLRCGAIDPHAFGLQVVHPHDPLVQGLFEVLPLLVIAQGIQHNTQPIIAPFLVA